MHISTSIPTMEMKADADAQAWARSARNVLTITNESIAETLLEANQLATTQGTALFCLPKTVNLNAESLKTIIEEAYQQMPRIQSEKDKLTVSQVAFLGVTHLYPCQQAQAQHSSTPFLMQHEQG
jgi:hypothetical protein